MEELGFKREAAAEYDKVFAHVTRYFMPFVLRAARIAHGMRVLDIAAGTGLSAEVALSAVGPTGHVTAADVSPSMVEKARERLGDARDTRHFPTLAGSGAGHFQLVEAAASFSTICSKR